MKNRGKSAAIQHKSSDFNYSISSDMPCIKHPNSSPIGVCSFCLKDKLLNLIYSNDTDTSSAEVGSVGRISFLLENEKQSKTEQVILLRSSSNSVEIKKSRNGFWKIKRLFRKNVRESNDEKVEISKNAKEGVSRSRSLCSFRGGGDDGNSDYRFSSAKISDVTGGLLFDYVEPRKSENGGDFKNTKKKLANSELVCSSHSPNMLPVLPKEKDRITFFKSPSNVNLDRGIFGNSMDDDDGGFKNLRKKFPNSELVCSSDSPNMLPVIQKRNTFRGSDTHMNTFLKSPRKVSSEKGTFFPVKESGFGKTMDDDDGNFKNLSNKFPNSESVCCSDSPNMLTILQKHTTFRGCNTHSATYLKSPSNTNSDRGTFFPVKESDFGNSKDSDSLNMLPHSCRIPKKRTTSYSASFFKSPSNTMDYDDDSAFIDLKLDLLSSSTSLSEPKLEIFSESTNSMGNLRGGSCRMNEYDKRMKEGNSGKGNKVWKWISKKKTTTSKRDEINSNLIKS